MKRDGLTTAVGGVGLFFVGAAVATFFSADDHSIKKEVDPLGLAQAGLTLLVGFFVTQVLTRRTGEKKFERELLGKHADAVVEASRDLEELVDAIVPDADLEAEDRRKLTRVRKCLADRIATLEELLALCHQGKPGDPWSKRHMTQVNIALQLIRRATGEEPITTLARASAIDGCADLQRNMARLQMDTNREHQ